MMSPRTGFRAAPVPLQTVVTGLEVDHERYAKSGGWFAARYRNGPLMWGCGIILLLVVGSFVVPAISPYSAWRPDATAALQSPNSSHLFGTDISGFDIFTRVFYAPRYDLSIAALGVLIGALIGVTVGVAAGFARGVVGEFVMRAADLVQAFPLLVLALAIVAIAGGSSVNLVAAVAFINAPVFLRLVRSRVLSIREQGYVEMAEALGNPTWRIVFVHILPNAIGPAIVQCGISLGYAILVIAGLGFLGVGLPVPTPEWGAMIQTGSTELTTGQWWTFVFPGAMLALAVAGFNLISEGIEISREV
jgi:peptide/nickel transport system permease protein